MSVLSMVPFMSRAGAGGQGREGKWCCADFNVSASPVRAAAPPHALGYDSGAASLLL